MTRDELDVQFNRPEEVNRGFMIGSDKVINIE